MEGETTPESKRKVTNNNNEGVETAPTHEDWLKAAGSKAKTREMKGIVIDHSVDHKTPVSQQFDVFYKAAKIAAGKMNPDLQKPMRTLEGLTKENFTIVFPDAEKWTNNGVVGVHKKEPYSRLWIEEQKGIKKRVKRYEEDLKKIFDIMHGQLSSGITEKLKIGQQPKSRLTH
eukprot:jgi/Psemu1/19893/gm1.19893_g